jgi:hypothetical protein
MASTYQIRQHFLKKIIKFMFNFFGYTIIKKNSFLNRMEDLIVEATAEELEIINRTIKIALASKLNLFSIIQSLKYIQNNNIKGDLVECGVFRGGSLALICFFSQKFNINSNIYGYDTFEDGFLLNEFSNFDKDSKGNKLDLDNFKNPENFYYTQSEVLKVLKGFFIKEKYLPKLIKGNIMQTLLEEKNLPKTISFLRLDTDLFKTTKLQLEILYPRLAKGGILHIDDYGHCPGVKKAVDDFFERKNVWLHRVDYTCRYVIKN